MTLIALLGSTLYSYLQRGAWAGLPDAFDFRVYYTASKVIIEGHTEHLYDTDWFYSVHVQPYQYFPFLAIILAPLSLLPFVKAAAVWMVINQLILAGSIWVTIKGLVNRDVRIILGIIILFLGFGPMDANMYWGQVNAVIMLCILLAWWAYKQDKPWLCGFMIALGTFIKIVPAILGVYFLYKQAYKVVWTGFISGVGLLLFSIIILGGFSEHVAWFTDMLPFLTGDGGMGKGGGVLNQSFLAMYIRMAQNGLFPESYAPDLHLISELIIMILSFALCRFERLTPKSPEFDLEFAAVSCLTVLMPQVTGSANYVYVFPAFIILLVYIVNNSLYSIPVFVCYGAAYTLVSLGAFGSGFFARFPLSLIQSSKLIGVLIVWTILGYLSLRLRGIFGNVEINKQKPLD